MSPADIDIAAALGVTPKAGVWNRMMRDADRAAERTRNGYRYSVRIDDTLREPVVIYIDSCGVTETIIRSTNIDDAEAAAVAWIDARTGGAA